MNRIATESRLHRKTQQKLLATAARISAEFSPVPACEQTTVRLLPLDPWHLHAHWQVPAHELRRLYKSKLPHLNPEAWVLRIYEVTPGEGVCPDSPWFEVPVQGSRSARDIKIGRDDVSYLAELGVRIGLDGLHALARSGEVRPPPAPPQPKLLSQQAPAATTAPGLPPLPDWRTLDDATFRKLFGFLLPEAWDGAGGLALNWLVRQRWNENKINNHIQAAMRAKGWDIDTNTLLAHGYSGASEQNTSSHTHAQPLPVQEDEPQ